MKTRVSEKLKTSYAMEIMFNVRSASLGEKRELFENVVLTVTNERKQEVSG